MIINHFSTYPYGGAATAADRIHQGIRERGLDGGDVNSRFFYSINDREPPADLSFVKLNAGPSVSKSIWQPFRKRANRRRLNKIYRLYDTHIAGRPEGLEVFSMPEQPDETAFDWNRLGGDVANLHWIAYGADYPSFFGSIPRHVPIVWTLHDMNPFTGGCHYSGDCSRFTLGCGQCPQVVAASDDDVSRDSFEVKRKVLKDRQLTIVTPSRWLGELAKQSSILPPSTRFETINYGLDLSQFRPLPKQDSREALDLGIAPDTVLIAFGAEAISNRRKGFHHLLEALRRLSTTNNVECLVFGSGEIPDDPRLPKMHQLGFIKNIRKQVEIYSAADLVVVPSREDNQPQVGLEAMACGTPVVGFDAGGIPEYVRDGHTGLIARLGDERHLAERISWLIERSEARQQMGDNALKMMRREFEMKTQTNEYLRLYRDLLQSNRVERAG